MLGAAVGGCAAKQKEKDPAASSLVYSPAERLPPERDRSAAAAPESAAQGADEERPPTGRRCRVHLRRDALGVAGQAPYPLAGNNLAADRASISGTLDRVGRDWVVVRGQRSTYWLPRDVVLSLEFTDDQ